MSCLAKLPETRVWLASWRAEKHQAHALRWIERAAVEQRANFQSCVSSGHWPSDWSAREYGACVRLIERAVRDMRKVAQP